MRNVKSILVNSVFEDGTFNISWRGGRMPMMEKDPIKFLDKIERPWEHDQRFILTVDMGLDRKFTFWVNEPNQGKTKVVAYINSRPPHKFAWEGREHKQTDLSKFFATMLNSIITRQEHKEYSVDILNKERDIMIDMQVEFTRTFEGRNFKVQRLEINQGFDSLIKEWVYLNENQHLLKDACNIDSWTIEPLPQPLAYVSAKGF